MERLESGNFKPFFIFNAIRTEITAKLMILVSILLKTIEITIANTPILIHEKLTLVQLQGNIRLTLTGHISI